MKIGLVGLPKSGKTTVFNALTGAKAEVTSYASVKAEPNIAIVNVADERVDKLSAMYRPKKTVYATIEIIDFVGIAKADKEQSGFSADYLRVIKTVDALAVVVRNFTNEAGDDPAPAIELRSMEEEMLLSDLIIADTRIERIEQAYKKGQKTPALVIEEKALRRIHEQLSANKPVRGLDFSDEEQKAVRGFQFLSQKPMLVILNSGEATFGKDPALVASLDATYPAVEFSGSFEMELAQLDDEESRISFMADAGITVSAKDRLTRAAHKTMGYISFFTVGEDEVRAWNIVQGDNAVLAAGAIHSDLARGFIRAECFGYEDLMSCGSEKAIKEKGHLRLEGKEYVVKDGDILNIRFNV